jgi:hypothetical protein
MESSPDIAAPDMRALALSIGCNIANRAERGWAWRLPFLAVTQLLLGCLLWEPASRA